MSRFIIGDDLGNIKTLRYSPNTSEAAKAQTKTVYRREESLLGATGVQQLATTSQSNDRTELFTAFSDGSCLLSAVNEADTLEVLTEWKEPRIVGGRFVGTSLKESYAFTCTSTGMLRKTTFTAQDGHHQVSPSETGTLPSRISDWRLAEDSETFAYGGDEVDLSVWNTELAFKVQPNSSATDGTKKRKRNEDLFPGEIWRARNVPNDHLGLRQPIRITALTYLSTSSAAHHLVTGTQFGDLRRYDTRAARRPVSNWTGIAKVGGVHSIQKGCAENELFMSDNGSNLYSIDLRTGSILYGYKGLSGAVASIALSPTFMASISLDRYSRIHSTIPPPAIAGSNLEQKGKVLEKTYLTSVPTVVVWDKCLGPEPPQEGVVDDDDEVWDNMERV